MKAGARIRQARRSSAAPPPPSSSSGIPLIGRSGLPWNASYFGMDTSITGANHWESWLGRDLDASMYFTGRSDWGALGYFNSSYASWPGYRIICVPPQPEPALSTATASGANNANWVAWANALKAAWGDDGRTIVRLGWENNGDWYKWGWGNAANYPNAATAASTFVAAFTNVVNSCRSVAPNLKFNCCMNTGSGRAGIDPYTHIWNPLLANGVLDIAGIDWYAWYPAPTSQANFDSKTNQSPGAANLHAWCAAHDVPMSIDEQGNVTGDASAGYGSGDDPAFWDKVWTWMQNHAIGNGGKVAIHTTYNDPGAPSSLRHVLHDTNTGTSQNPNAAARYKQLWG